MRYDNISELIKHYKDEIWQHKRVNKTLQRWDMTT